MFKRKFGLFVILFLLSVSVQAVGGNLFQVTASGGVLPQEVSLTLCLNISGSHTFSCQNYTINKATLNIKTTVPNHTYPYAGIKINTPGFNYDSPSGSATNAAFAYIGAVSDTAAVTGSVTSEEFNANSRVFTTTTLYSALNPSTTGSSVTFTASVSSADGTIPAGTVAFNNNGLPIPGCGSKTLDSGLATCTTNSLVNGSPDEIVATYTPAFDAAFAESTSATFDQYVVNSLVQTTAPSEPLQVIAVPGNSRAVLRWFPPTNTGGQSVTQYRVYYGVTGNPPYNILGCTTSSALSCTVTGLTNNTSYTFAVTASNPSGAGLAAYSSPVTPAALLIAAPTHLALSVNDTRVNSALTGNPRAITLTNNSLAAVTGITIQYPGGWGSDASPSATSTCVLH